MSNLKEHKVVKQIKPSKIQLFGFHSRKSVSCARTISNLVIKSILLRRH